MDHSTERKKSMAPEEFHVKGTISGTGAVNIVFKTTSGTSLCFSLPSSALKDSVAGGDPCDFSPPPNQVIVPGENGT